MSMPGYTKLFNSILASTIWRESDKVRIVWITMLAMADKRGVVEGSVPGLADFARVSIEDVEKALESLQSPDVYSRTKTNEGRRIQAVDGGWVILNHGKYREKMNADERKAYNREKQREWRAGQKLSTKVNDCQSQLPTSITGEQCQHIAAPSPSPSPSPSPNKEKNNEVTSEEIYQAYPRKVAKADAIRAITKAMKEEPAVKLLSATLAYAEFRKGQDHQFTPHPASWFNGKRYDDDPKTYVHDTKPNARNINCIRNNGVDYGELFNKKTS